MKRTILHTPLKPCHAKLLSLENPQRTQRAVRAISRVVNAESDIFLRARSSLAPVQLRQISSCPGKPPAGPSARTVKNFKRMSTPLQRTEIRVYTTENSDDGCSQHGKNYGSFRFRRPRDPGSAARNGGEL